MDPCQRFWFWDSRPSIKAATPTNNKTDPHTATTDHFATAYEADSGDSTNGAPPAPAAANYSTISEKFAAARHTYEISDGAKNTLEVAAAFKQTNGLLDHI